MNDHRPSDELARDQYRGHVIVMALRKTARVASPATKMVVKQKKKSIVKTCQVMENDEVTIQCAIVLEYLYS